MAFGENYLKATNLTKAIKEMHEDKKFSKMVFYVEACESHYSHAVHYLF